MMDVKPKQFGDLKVYIDANTFGWIVMDRQGSSSNVLGKDVLASMSEVVKFVELEAAQGRIKCLILTSAKDTFCLGANVEEIYGMTDPNEARSLISGARNMLAQLQKIDVPKVAAINGTAMGGGLELALACDYRVCADKAVMALPEIKLGVMPGLGGTVRFPRLCGVQAALTHVLAASNIHPPKAKRMGLVDAVVEGKDRYENENRFMAEARSFAGKQIDKKKRKKKLPLMRRILESGPGLKLVANMTEKSLNKMGKDYNGPWAAFASIMNAMREKSEEKAMDFEMNKFAELAVTQQAKNLQSVYFMMEAAKKVEQAGLKTEDVKPVNQVGVVGSGVMGSGVVHFMANKGYKVFMTDLNDAALQKGKDFCTGEFKTALKKKRLNQLDFEKRTGNITADTNNAPLKECDVMIEAAVEVMDVKKKMLTAFEGAGVLHNNIFATNTSSLSVTDLATAASKPENVVGMHFFNPVAKMPLVEVIAGKKSSPAAVATVYNLAAKTGKVPIKVGDAPGFLVNRVLGIYMSEAGRLLEEGADCKKVDKLIKDFGLPMGPFRLLDEVGLDVAAHVAPILRNGLGDRFLVNERIGKIAAAGTLGVKSKAGFYLHPDKPKGWAKTAQSVQKMLSAIPGMPKVERNPVNAALMAKEGIKFKSSFDYSDVVDRCILCMVNEAVMILDEGIASSPEDVDVGMIFGTGFAPFHGGLLSYADQRGLPEVVARLEQMASQYGDRFAPCKRLFEMARDKKLFFPNRPRGVGPAQRNPKA